MSDVKGDPMRTAIRGERGRPHDSDFREEANRDVCYRCLRARSVCFCADIRSIAPSFRTVLLQHPKERKNSIGTARLTHLSVEDSVLVPGTGFEKDPVVSALLADPGNLNVVLFPGSDAYSLPERVEDLRTLTGERKLVVFVIDGTWSLAKGMLRRSPRIASLPKVCFTPERPSQYKVRKQPAPHCLSTIEAVHSLVRALNPELEADRLLEYFARMVDRQAAHQFEHPVTPTGPRERAKAADVARGQRAAAKKLSGSSRG